MNEQHHFKPILRVLIDVKMLPNRTLTKRYAWICVCQECNRISTMQDDPIQQIYS